MSTQLKYFKAPILLTISLLIIIGCKEKNDNYDASEIAINSNLNLESNIFNLIENVETFQLYHKDSSNFIFQNITKVIMHKDNYYLKNDHNQIYQVDKIGTLLNTLDSQGNGPNEYREIKDFDINLKTNELFVYDFQKQRFLVFDLNFNFLRTENIGYNFISFKFIDNNIALYTAKHRNKINDTFYDYDIILVDSNFNIIENSIPFDNENFELTRINKKNPFITIDDRVYFNDIISDTIYSISDKEVNVAFQYKYTNKTLSKEYKEMSHEKLLERFRNNSHEFEGLDLLANILSLDNEFAVTSFSHNSENFFSLSSLKTGATKSYKFPKGSNDESHKKILSPFLSNKGTLVTIAYPYVLRFIKEQYLEKFKTENHITQKIDAILETSFDDGNPVLINYTIKKI